ncbi:ribonuclease HI [Brevibacterium sanguinis]|uniref:Ribonuclease H n=2 Tax=Brevibacterium TaxID=1696 RepID=A0A366IIM3_9MICO|nr:MULTISPECIES: ribonuclease H [Brevibacterium]RBP64644.1 ribonuclease HI [Brevibacterium sanguinis]RBP71713.1 ribonuclease HI [Brevibacterium celere]
MTIIAAADGSALGNPGPAGWAWYIDDGCWHAGGWPESTNNRGELMAVLDLLRSTAEVDDDLLVYCDSQYVINALTKWMPGWKRRGWKKADGKEVLNRDLLAELDEALTGRSVEFEWVRGHSDHTMNEAADRRARAAATAFQDGTTVPEGPGFVTAEVPESVPFEQSEPVPTPSTGQPRPAGPETTVVSCRVPTAVADELVARAHAAGVHPQSYLADLIGRSLENE